MDNLPLEGCKCAFCITLLLPSVLQNELFCEWLGLADLGRLDSAVCNRAHRGALWTVWIDDHFVLKSSEEIVVTELVAAWVSKRRIKIGKDISIPEFVAETGACKDFFETTGSTLTRIRYPEGLQLRGMDSLESISSMQTLFERASTCKNLKEIAVSCIDMSKVSLRPVLENCTNLKTVSLAFARSLNYRELNESGQYIEHLILIAPSGKGAPENPDPSDFKVFNKTNTMKRLDCDYILLDCDESDRSRLVLYVCSNVGLRQLRVDRILTHHMFWILEACTELHALRLDVLDCEGNLDDVEVAQLIENMQNLRYLHLIGPGLTHTGLMKLLENCDKLQKLYMYDFQDSNADDPDDSYSEVAVNASPPLTVLHVPTITTPTLAAVLYTYPKITNIGIGLSTVESFDSALQVLHNYNITELHLGAPRGCTFANIHLLQNLAALYLYDCAGLTNDHLLTIARNNPQLTSLRIYSAGLVASETVIELVKLCQKLKSLRLDHNPGGYTRKQKLFEDTLKALCPSLVDLDVNI